ncbi:fibroblast growth factor receptor 4-like [Oculina patagonica]
MTVIYHILTTSLLMALFNESYSLSFVTEPNKTTIASTGSNPIFTWKLSLTEQEKSGQLKVMFGRWNKDLDVVVGHYLIILTREVSGKEALSNGSQSIVKRLHWTGDLTLGYVAFTLFNVHRHDSGNYGIRVRVDQDHAPETAQSWFSLSVEDPPTLPPKTQELQNSTLVVEEGRELNITCRSRMEANSSVLWIKDSLPVQKGKSRFLYIRSVNRSQAGNYICVSLSSNGNLSSPITTVDVLYAPSIHFPTKRVSVELLRGNSTTLKCVAAANPSPTFSWNKHGEKISDGFNSTWNSTTLAVTPVNDNDFTSYACTAKNRVGWDSVTFILQDKGFQAIDSTDASTQLKDDEDTTVTKYLAITVALVVAVIFAFLIRRYLARRSRGQINRSESGDADENNTEVSFLALNPSFSGDPGWEIPRANLNVEKVIGRGAFGVVSRGLVLDLPEKPGWTVVAVKSLQEDASEREKRDLLSEMSLLKHLDPHPHVICLYGCVTTEARPLVVVEYAQYGDVLGYLRKSRGFHDNYYSDPSVQPRTTLTSEQLLKFAWEISDGMDYLSKKKIIHRDLAARNVLVGDEEVCKITDFGMARDVQEEDIYVRTQEGRIPIKWTAPEALFGSGAYTTASDVWSFGVVMYEIFTVGGDPFPGVYMREIPTLLKNGYRMSRPKFVNQKLYEMMTECWKDNPSERPSFECLRSMLQSMIRDKEQEYVNLKELFYENVLPSGCSGE